ncbi:PREDICTED: uncharacterized protein LOC106541088, partial [Thamnophis sirtalis]|uniref:Uncharacterized protein LOC106541088 n=1 Tax=Thamnophis sirtalis TaxID=35019 RepID=A0A6I9XM35_9SAUR
ALPSAAAACSQPPPALPAEQEEAAGEAAILPALGGRLLWQDARPSGPLEAASEVEELDRRRAGKREKQETRLETEELPDPTFRYWQPEQGPWLQGGGELEGGGGDCAGEPAKRRRRKKKERSRERLAEGAPAAIKEEPLDVPCLGGLPEENLRAIGEDPVGEAPSCKKRKKRSRERLPEGGAAAIKEEPLDVPCLGSLPEEGLGSPREETGREFAGYIKQSPGKEAGGLWGVAALKEELGDVPSLGSLGVTPEDPTEEPPSYKKKKKKKSRERGAEGLCSITTVKEEPGDTSCLESLLGLGSARGGPAGDLLACKKKKKKGGKLDKEPLQEQEAAPLWQEPGLEEPLQTNWASPSPQKKRREGRRREGEDQAGLSAAGT